MVTNKKVWVVEELEVNGVIAHRQTESSYTEKADGSWSWNVPEDRLTDEGKAEWTRVMNVLKDVKGEDFRHLVSAVSLMTHCLEPNSIENYAD